MCVCGGGGGGGWMEVAHIPLSSHSNGVAHISDFLSNLTVKTKSTKDQFFR